MNKMRTIATAITAIKFAVLMSGCAIRDVRSCAVPVQFGVHLTQTRRAFGRDGHGA